jgi:hypothetical protein
MADDWLSRYRLAEQKALVGHLGLPAPPPLVNRALAKGKARVSPPKPRLDKPEPAPDMSQIRTALGGTRR